MCYKSNPSIFYHMPYTVAMLVSIQGFALIAKLNVIQRTPKWRFHIKLNESGENISLNDSGRYETLTDVKLGGVVYILLIIYTVISQTLDFLLNGCLVYI